MKKTIQLSMIFMLTFIYSFGQTAIIKTHTETIGYVANDSLPKHVTMESAVIAKENPGEPINGFEKVINDWQPWGYAKIGVQHYAVVYNEETNMLTTVPTFKVYRNDATVISMLFFLLLFPLSIIYGTSRAIIKHYVDWRILKKKDISYFFRKWWGDFKPIILAGLVLGIIFIIALIHITKVESENIKNMITMIAAIAGVVSVSVCSLSGPTSSSVFLTTICMAMYIFIGIYTFSIYPLLIAFGTFILGLIIGNYFHPKNVEARNHQKLPTA